jgi:hypothetical protein
VIANGLAAPLRRQCFNTLLTPWFIDVVPSDLRDFMGVLRSLLAPNGRWINFGPLLYPERGSASCQFSVGELFELATIAGFQIEKAH